MNLPNLITMARIALVPLFIWLLLDYSDQWQRWLALLVFIVAMASDGLDGAIARRRGLITNLGKILDPIADKALIGGALVSLSLLAEVHWGFTLAILARELTITIYRLAVIRDRVIPASGAGKFKTIFQSIVIGALVSPFGQLWPWLQPLLLLLLVATVLITLATGIQYLWAAIKAAR